MYAFELFALIQFHPINVMKKQSVENKIYIKKPCRLFVEKKIWDTVRFRFSLLPYRFQRIIIQEREPIGIENTFLRNRLLLYGCFPTN